MDFDPGPPQRFARIFARLPDLSPIRQALWFDWGPIFYRGRLDGSARILCVASDPGPTERIAGRTLVGDAGQRVQGFLAKLGLSRSYLCLNAFPYALFPSWAMGAPRLLALPEFAEWRNDLYDRAADGIEVVVAFGGVARTAMAQWPGAEDRHVIELPHPSSREPAKLIAAWRAAVPSLRSRVTPDDATVPTPNYGTRFSEADYAPIPPRDLPFGVPPWVGDNAWSRAGTPRRNNSVKRPEPDDRHTLIWTAPTTQP
jgi:hypothetical protein